MKVEALATLRDCFVRVFQRFFFSFLFLRFERNGIGAKGQRDNRLDYFPSFFTTQPHAHPLTCHGERKPVALAPFT